MSRVDLRDKRVLISGASGGLGRALAVELARRGAKLALLARGRAGLAETERLVREAGATEVRLYRADVGKPAVRAVAARVARDFGGLDILVNNAGVHAFAPVADLPEELLREALEVNLFGVLRLTQGALPALRRSHGLVVNIGSTLGYRAIPNAAAYCATKGALARFSESLRDEEGRYGLRVLHASPGVVLTGLRDNALRHNAEVSAQDKLPFPREAGETAQEICDAMARGEREMISAAPPVKLWARVLAPWFGAWLDSRMKVRP
jgi:NAD(P)-dependent dehydrogenase (short-subunit alcohol dehydrogenase family)